MSHATQLIKVLLAGTMTFAGIIASARADDALSDETGAQLRQKVMVVFPRYGEIPETSKPAPTHANAEVEPEVTHLAPLVIFGRRRTLKFDELALLTEKARDAALRKRYGSASEYAEEKRIQETIRLRDYANNLKLTGDHLESAVIRKEIDRLLVGRNSDWVSQGIDRMFNPRYR